jgi:hypothetical protein
MSRSAARVAAGLQALGNQAGDAGIGNSYEAVDDARRLDDEWEIDRQELEVSGNLYGAMDVVTRNRLLRPFVRAAKQLLKRLLSPVLIKQAVWNEGMARLLGRLNAARRTAADQSREATNAPLAELRREVESLRARMEDAEKRLAHQYDLPIRTPNPSAAISHPTGDS